MNFRYKDKVKIKSGFYAGHETVIQDSGMFGLEYLCSNRELVDYGSSESFEKLFTGRFWFWQLEKVEK